MSPFTQALVSDPQAAAIELGYVRVTVIATAEQTAGAFGIWESFVPPGSGPDLHVHSRETEMFRVIAGRFRFRCGDDEFEAGVGVTVTLPPYVPHAWKNIGETDGHVFAIVTPGGFEQFFLDAARQAALSREDLIALQARRGVRVL